MDKGECVHIQEAIWLRVNVYTFREQCSQMLFTTHTMKDIYILSPLHNKIGSQLV